MHTVVDMSDSTAEKAFRSDESGSADEKASAAAASAPRQEDSARQRLQPPECIRNLTPEERAQLERRLKRKVDIRLLPAIIIMYILNYIDRCVVPSPPPSHPAPGAVM